MFAVRRLSSVAALKGRIASTGVRSFMAAAPIRKDLVQDLYLNEIRAYRPPATDATAKANLVEKFVLPTPPPVPEIETASSEGAIVEDAIAEEEWPPLYNAIDDPHNYPDDWEIRTEVDKGNMIPDRLKVFYK
ncbi:hypothetical protein HDU97_003856 [Phlyctochytrium planicorne]|nr:hypothetical protein HDU97_003856 [Phlyctochytrium planicorne]